MSVFDRLLKLAESGDRSAQYNAGKAYFDGEYVENGKNILSQDKAKAIFWFTKAAEQGDPFAQYDLGVCYYHGDGVGRDVQKAADYLAKAAAQDFEKAQDFLREYGKYTESVVAALIQKAESGNKNAQIELGDCYQHGKGVERDSAKMNDWWAKAAEQTHAEIARRATGEVKDMIQNAEEGDAEAQYELGRAYRYNKYGIPVNCYQAVRWWTRAALQNHARAQYELFWCYYYGYGTQENHTAAKAYLVQAIENGQHAQDIYEKYYGEYRPKQK